MHLNTWLASLELDTPARVGGTFTLALVVAVVARRLIDAVFAAVVDGDGRLARAARWVMGRTDLVERSDVEAALVRARRRQRAHAVASLVRSATTFTVVVIATVHILRVLDVDIAKLLTAAGLVSVVLGFGAQTLIKDFIAGLFLILEEQYGLGDVVDVGPASGTVEQIGLRVTRIRADDGTVWIVRNGEILRVGNKTQGWSRAVVEVKIDYDEDLDAAQDALLAAGAAVVANPRFGPFLLDEPDVRGIEAMTADSVLLRLRVKTIPSRQWEVARALRAAVRDELSRRGVALASQHHELPSPDEVPATAETPILDAARPQSLPASVPRPPGGRTRRNPVHAARRQARRHS